METEKEKSPLSFNSVLSKELKAAFLYEILKRLPVEASTHDLIAAIIALNGTTSAMVVFFQSMVINEEYEKIKDMVRADLEEAIILSEHTYEEFKKTK